MQIKEKLVIEIVSSLFLSLPFMVVGFSVEVSRLNIFWVDFFWVSARQCEYCSGHWSKDQDLERGDTMPRVWPRQIPVYLGGSRRISANLKDPKRIQLIIIRG